jgi:endonuclease/exonuclease/phosphatase family metal-dependent hydrolase
MSFILTFPLILPSATGFGQDTLVIATYNLLNYQSNDTSRNSYFRTVIAAVNPDILAVQEMTSQTGMDNFLNNVMNAAGVGTYAAGTFVDGNDTDNGVFYKASRISFVETIAHRTTLRDISEFVFFSEAIADTLRVYSLHLKAGSGTAEQIHRAAEVDTLRSRSNFLPSGKYFIVLGDFNIYRSGESAYQKLIEDGLNVAGKFVDALTLTGTWNNSSYAPYHTQSPRTRSFGGGATGGLDDRFDMILYSTAFTQSSPMLSYVPGSMTAFGNDALHYNDSINRLPNNAVSDEVVSALHYASDHLPVVAKFSLHTANLPITLASFTGRIVAPNDVLLEWSTLTEVNNYGFFVQRRIHGTSDFVELPQSFVPGHGTTIEPQSYSWLDETASPGTYEYRLRQVDLDGSHHFTHAITVPVGVLSVVGHPPVEWRVHPNYPNPFNPETVIRYSVPVAGRMALKIFNTLGQEVAVLVDGEISAGDHQTRWNAASMPGGVYFLRFEAGTELHIRKMTLLK